ncbi:MAG: DUF308 domain-containing protein [Prolixibacteraceae bacterium]|nr:DUF308 domain-containing protein [Prolixibacteraceae bacterium]
MMFQRAYANPNRILIRGIITILFGIAAIAVPGLSLEVVIRFMGALLMLDGFVNLIVGLIGKQQNQSTFIIVPRGTSNLIIGLVLVLFPSFMVSIFVFVIGIILLFAGITQLASQIGGKNLPGISWVIALSSVIAILAGVIMLFNPFESAKTILIVFGTVITLYGIGEVVRSFRVRKFRKENPPEPPRTVDADYEEV